VTVAWGAEPDRAADMGSVAEVRHDGTGVYRVELVFYQPLSLLPDAAGVRYDAEPDGAGVFCDPMPSAVVLERLRERVWVRTLEAIDVAAAAAEFRMLLKDRRVQAVHHPALEQAVTFAQRRPLAAAYGFERVQVPCDMSPLNAAAFAVWGLRRHESAGDVAALVM
jgi:hypothetical protein